MDAETIEVQEVEPQKVQKQVAAAEAADVREWLHGLAGDTAIRVTIRRKRPKNWKGHNVAGSLETVEEFIDEEYIRDTHGGGTFELRVQKQNAKGNWQYFTARTIEIAGPPKTDGLAEDDDGQVVAAPAPSHDSDVVKQALRMTDEQLRRAQERADGGNGHGFDPLLLQTLNAPLIAQLEASQRETAELRRQMFDVMNKPDESPFRGLAEKMYDGENARLEALRQQRDSEMRVIRENHAMEIKMLREQHRDDLKQREKAHEREIEVVRQSYGSQVDSNKVAWESRIDGLKSEISRLERELGEAKSEIGTLRAKKEKTIPEQAQEIMAVKEAISAIGGDSDDDSDKPWYRQVIDGLGNSDAVMSLVSKLGGGEEGQAMPPQQQLPPGQPEAQPGLPPVGVPFQMEPGGDVYVRQPDGQVVKIDPNAAKRQRAAAARAKAGEAPAPEAEEPTELQPTAPSPDQVAAAVAFMENAINNGTDPAAFGATARNLIPADILLYIQQVGVDAFLTQVANLEANSPLATQHGRNFARKVAKFLVEGTTEE
jgi:hypothetical protein